MRTALLLTATSLLVTAATSCVVALPPDDEPPPDDTPIVWNPPRSTPLACTRVHHVDDEARDPDLPTDPGGGVGPIFNAVTPDDAASSGGTDSVGQKLSDPSEVKVETPQQLVDVLASEFQGTIIIPRDVDWDLTAFTYTNGNQKDDGLGLKIKGHVVLRGERGELCSRPILRDTRLTKHNLFTVIGSDVLIEGIHFIGPMNGNRSVGENVSGIGMRVYFYTEHRNRYIRVRDNEMREWTAAAVDISSTWPGTSLEDWDYPEVPTSEFANDIVVEQNIFHHNSRNGGGYGVSVGSGTHASVFGNVFEANRHAIASDGRPYSGYQAKYNYVQEGGFKDHGSYQQHFDVHGEFGGYGGLAGQYYLISNNTFRGEQEYYGIMTRPAFMLRGRPTQGAHFLDNVLVHDDLSEAVRLKGILYGTPQLYNFTESGNSFDTDYSKEVAVGDFDGDGRSDMFVANGTGWFVSRAGVEPWQLVNPSRVRVKDLGFADMNNDRVTDVVRTAPDGTLEYYPFGGNAPVSIGHSPVSASSLRFGDFDGDGKMDVFRRELLGKWWILYSGDSDWTPVGAWPTALSELRFGNFDDVPGTDVITGTTSGWLIRSGAKGAWLVMNEQLTTSLKDSVIADFDGNGRDDVGFIALEATWRFVPQGRGPLKTLRPHMATDPKTKGLPYYVGHFEHGTTKAQVLTWELKSGSHHDRSFTLWGGLGGNVLWVDHSRLNMR